MMTKFDRNNEKSENIHFGHDSMLQTRGGSRIVSMEGAGFSKNVESFANLFFS